VAASPCRSLIEISAGLVELLGQRTTMAKAVERDVGRQMRGRGQLESALRRDAQIRVPAVQFLLLQYLEHTARGFAVKLGPERVISAAQEGGIGTGSRNFSHALTAKREGQRNI